MPPLPGAGGGAADAEGAAGELDVKAGIAGRQAIELVGEAAGAAAAGAAAAPVFMPRSRAASVCMMVLAPGRVGGRGGRLDLGASVE
jgi:hypothetical protein